MWEAKNKRDLMIEVWEKLDCESVGADEIRSVEEVVTASAEDAMLQTEAEHLGATFVVKPTTSAECIAAHCASTSALRARK